PVPEIVPARVELDDIYVSASLAELRTVSEVDLIVKIADDDHVAICVHRDPLRVLVALTPEGLAPDVVASRVDLGHKSVAILVRTYQRAAPEIHRTLENTGDVQVVRSVRRKRKADLIVPIPEPFAPERLPPGTAGRRLSRPARRCPLGPGAE